MSAPPLPEVFGNYALGEFTEVVAPGAISWLPQTQGWFWVGLALGLYAARQGWLRLREWHRNRYRREALARLTELQSGADAGLPTHINHLLKRTALAAWPRRQVARLSGREWVAFLNSACDPQPFGGELGQLLADGPYGVVSAEDDAADRLVQACARWISDHRGPRDV